MNHPVSLPGSASVDAWEGAAVLVGPKELAALYEAGATLSQTLDLKEIHEAIVLAARQHFGFDRAGLWLYDARQERIRGSAGTDENLNLRREDDFSAPVEEVPASTRAVITGESPFYFTADLQGESPSNPNPTMRGVHYNAVVPLRIGSETLGFLSVDNLVSDQPITEAHVRLLLLYANYAAVALKNAMAAEQAREHRAETKLRQQLERKLERLQQVHEMAATMTSLDLDSLLRFIRNQIVEEFGFDRAGVLLLDPHNPGLLRGTWGTDWAGQLTDEHDVDYSISEQPDLETIISGESTYLLNHWETEFSAPVDESIRQHLLVLLRSAQRILGVISVDNLLTGRAITEENVEILLLVAEHAALAIQKAHVYALEQDVNARLRKVLSRESRIATTLQKAFKPVVGTFLYGIRIAHLYRPSLFESELGGDFFDVLDLGLNRIGLVMADVSGKGLSAATRAARARYALQAYALEDPHPVSVITRLNRFLYKAIPESAVDYEGFVTLFYGVLNAQTGELHCVSSGHEPPVLMKRGQEPELLEMTGIPTGVMAEPDIQDYHYRLDIGDRFLLYSDGVTEARQNKVFFDFEGLLQTVREDRDRPPDSLIRRLYARVLRYSGGSLRDDVALLMIERE